VRNYFASFQAGQSAAEKSAKGLGEQVSKVSKTVFDTFDTCPKRRTATFCPVSDNGLSEFGNGRQMMAAALARHECPDGCGPLVLQDRARDVWFCPACRLWVVEGTVR